MPSAGIIEADGSAETTDNTPAIVAQADLPEDSAFQIEIQTVAHRPSNGDWRVWRHLFHGKRDGGGSASVQGSLSLLASQGNLGSVGWTPPNVEVNGSQNYTLDTVVTGPNGVTINWAVSARGLRISA